MYNQDNSIPAWLETPPVSEINPPVQPRKQELPFGELSWEDFEKLCLRLARLEFNVEHCQVYGTRGQDQQGIDLYARHKFATKYRVYQCKREKNFGPSKIKKAVNKFLSGKWVDKTETFILCTKESLSSTERADELERQRELLKKQDITLLPWDCNTLSLKLKENSKIVDDFFGREWVVAFCGQQEADRLSKRLDKSQVIEFRKKLRLFYKSVFKSHDPGLPIASPTFTNSLDIEARYVIPDITDKRSLTFEQTSSIERDENDQIREKLENDPFADKKLKAKQQASKATSFRTSYEQKQSVDSWLNSETQNVILGKPGSGKSTLLRFIAIDLLQESPRMSLLAQKWGRHLPIWIPFALWTKIISSNKSTPCSLSQLMHDWLQSWNEERLWPLVEQALEDERLLLLVDGLDEWTNESAARITADQLKVFVELRDLPTIVTSRPKGYTSIGMNYAGWRVGELSDLAIDQQRELSLIWFNFWFDSIYQESNSDREQVVSKAKFETENFISELNRSSDFQELAKIPLLLCIMISLKLQNIPLPRNRFKAYDLLIDHLISIHPKKRRTAAFVSEDTLSELSDGDIKNILAYLAYYIQFNFREGLIDPNEAIGVVEKYLENNEFGFGLDRHQARAISQKLLEITETTLGLLVRLSPHEIGFFHRVFKEYLAAYHLSKISIEEQMTTLKKYCGEPQWREVFLGLFFVTNRSEDVRKYIDCIRERFKSAKIPDRFSIETLLSETAFGEFNCPISIARDIANETFHQIEFGCWMPQRERLLISVLDGLGSTKLKDVVKSKIAAWFPCRSRWRESLFRAMSRWQRSSQLIECLWKGIHDEEISNQRAAVKTFAKLAEGELQLGDKLGHLARFAIEPRVRAVAIEGLIEGWPNHKEMENILKEARNSESTELRLVAIGGYIKKQSQSAKDWEELIQLGSSPGSLDWYWRYDIASFLTKGWPSYEKTKEVCLDVAQNRYNKHDSLELEIAQRVLLEGFPNDQDVIQFCVNEIKYQVHPFLMLHHDAWILLKQNFKDEPVLVKVIDEWIPKQKYSEPELSFAALVGRTEIAKKALISNLKSWIPFWSANALLEGWGMKDPEVHEHLSKMSAASASEASNIAYLLPEIVEDREECHQRLLELLRDPDSKRIDFIMQGFARLGNTVRDSEIVDTALEVISTRSDVRYADIVPSLIVNYPSDPRLKNLAIEELNKRDGSYAAVAWSFGDDVKIRSRLIDIACPIPNPLRKVIATYLEQATDEASVFDLLRLYDHEADEEVKTLASISYHKRLKYSGRNINEVLNKLSKNIISYGLDYEERRQAAFCGLSILNRLDLMKNAVESIGDKKCKISVGNPIKPNVPLLIYILENWDQIKSLFGSEFWLRISKWTSDIDSLWDTFLPFVDQYPSPRNEALEFLESKIEKKASRNILLFLSKVRPKSQIFLEYCIETLRLGVTRDHFITGDGILSAQLLGRHFGHEKDVLSYIKSKISDQIVDERLIVAICEGWPELNELNELDKLLKEKQPKLSYAAYFEMLTRKASTKRVFSSLRQIFHDLNRINPSHSKAVANTIIRRLKKDEELVQQLFQNLENVPTQNEKVNFPRLIKTAKGNTQQLYEWCTEELDRQNSKYFSPQFGFDMFSGELSSVHNSLLEVLE